MGWVERNPPPNFNHLPFEPQHTEKITDNKDFMTRMLKQAVTRIPNGMTGALIQRNFMGQLYLAPTTIKQLSLSDKCRAISTFFIWNGGLQR